MNENIKLVPYTDADYEFVYEVKKNAYKKYVEECWGAWVEKDQRTYFEKFIEAVRNNAYIIMNEATKIGFYNGGVLENGNYEVKNICILPEYQGKGIGTKLLKENNLPDIRFHDLRATYSTLLLKNNFNSKAISKLMGHATDIITMDVYGDNDEIIADCVDELDSFIESVRPENNESEIQIGDESDISIDENILNELTVF